MNRADWHAHWEPKPPTRPNPSKPEEIDWDGLSRHDWPLALGIIVVFIAVFVIPTLLGWHP